MSEKKITLNSPFSPNGVKHPGQGSWDENYESIEIVDVVKKIGDGDDDYVIVKKVNRSYTPIKDVVEADRDNVGVAPILKAFVRTGDESLLPMEKEASTVDLVGAPSSIMEIKQQGVDAEKAFAGLPHDLTQGMDMKAFVEGMSQEKFNQFIQAVAARQAKKQEVKTDE